MSPTGNLCFGRTRQKPRLATGASSGKMSQTCQKVSSVGVCSLTNPSLGVTPLDHFLCFDPLELPPHLAPSDPSLIVAPKFLLVSLLGRQPPSPPSQVLHPKPLKIAHPSQSVATVSPLQIVTSTLSLQTVQTSPLCGLPLLDDLKIGGTKEKVVYSSFKTHGDHQQATWVCNSPSLWNLANQDKKQNVSCSFYTPKVPTVSTPATEPLTEHAFVARPADTLPTPIDLFRFPSFGGDT